MKTAFLSAHYLIFCRYLRRSCLLSRLLRFSSEISTHETMMNRLSVAVKSSSVAFNTEHPAQRFRLIHNSTVEIKFRLYCIAPR